MDMAYQGENEEVIVRRSGNIVFRVDWDGYRSFENVGHKRGFGYNGG